MTVKPTHNVVHEANGVDFRETPAQFFARQPNNGPITDLQHYRELYQKSISDPEGFLVHWPKSF